MSGATKSQLFNGIILPPWFAIQSQSISRRLNGTLHSEITSREKRIARSIKPKSDIAEKKINMK